MPSLKARQSEDSSPNLTKDCRIAMSTDKPFRTDYEFLKGVDYIFVSLDRNLSGEECHELAEKYFEAHKQMTLPGQVLLVDLCPAYRKTIS
jgi:hypothetical protein